MAPNSGSSRPPPGPTSGLRESDGAGKSVGTQPARKGCSLAVHIHLNLLSENTTSLGLNKMRSCSNCLHIDGLIHKL